MIKKIILLILSLFFIFNTSLKKKKKKYKFINENLEIKVEKIGDKKVIIVDNFLKYPESYKKIMNTNLTYDNYSAFPGIRIPVNKLISDELSDFVYKKIKPYFFTKGNIFSDSFRYSIINESNKTLQLASKIPHQDCLTKSNTSEIPDGSKISGIATVVYLCEPSKKYGGTGIYDLKHPIGYENFYKKKENKVLIDKLFHYLNRNEYCIDKEEVFFKKIYESQVKFNRVIFYSTRYLHQPIINTEYYNLDQRKTEDPRLTITGWQYYDIPLKLKIDDIPNPVNILILNHKNITMP